MPRDHTAHHRELLSRNLAKVEASLQQAKLHGADHQKKMAARHDALIEEQAVLEKQLEHDHDSWTPENLHELETIQKERRLLAHHI